MNVNMVNRFKFFIKIFVEEKKITVDVTFLYMHIYRYRYIYATCTCKHCGRLELECCVSKLKKP